MEQIHDEVKLGPHAPRVPEADRAQVERAIEEAERATGAEFVVVVAARSGRYDRAEDLFGLVSGLLGVTAAWLLFQGVMPNPEAWETGWTLTLGLPLVLGIFAGWSVLGAVLATRVPLLARPFISRLQMEQEVATRSREAFDMFRVDGGPESPGVLIYISLLERRVLIAANDAAGAAPGGFDGARDALLADIAEGKGLGASLASAVTRCTGVVQARPSGPEARRNRLPNTVRLMW